MSNTVKSHLNLRRENAELRKTIAEIIADKHGLTIEQLASKTKLKNYCDARFMIVGMCKDLDIYYQAHLATMFNRNHATIFYALEVHHNYTLMDKDYRKYYDYCKQSVKRWIENNKSETKTIEINVPEKHIQEMMALINPIMIQFQAEINTLTNDKSN